LSPRALYRLHDGLIYLAETSQPAIRVFSGDGGLVRDIRWDPGPRPAPDAALRIAIDGAASRAPEGQAESRRAQLEGFPPPQRVPAFWDFLVDDLGFIWVRPYDPARHVFDGMGGGAGPGRGGGWLILSPEGAVLDTVVVPDALEPMQITRDAVVGIVRDELDVQHVHVHPVERR
jgi:hypothetical protein